jgi:ribonucleoside-diphosphate reductase alpha chain
MCGCEVRLAGGACARRAAHGARSRRFSMAPRAEIAAEKGFSRFTTHAAFSPPPMSRACPSMCVPRSRRYGIRNGCLTSIAPTGTISLLAGNVSSGHRADLRPSAYKRRVRCRPTVPSAARRASRIFAYRRFRRELREQRRAAARRLRRQPDMLAPAAHLAMQAAAQKHVDSAISKTINCPRRHSPSRLSKSIYTEAYALGSRAARPIGRTT